MAKILLVFMGDILAFWLSLTILLFLRYNTEFEAQFLLHVNAFTFVNALWILIFYLFGLYEIIKIKPTIPFLKLFTLALTTAFFVGIALFYLIPAFGITPKTNLFFLAIFFFIISFAFRRLLFQYYATQIKQPVALVGATRYIQELKKILNENPQIGLSINKHFSNLEDFFNQNNNFKSSILIFEKNNQRLSQEKLVAMYQKGVEILDIGKAYEKYLYKIPIEYISDEWIIENLDNKTNKAYALLSRIVDMALATIIIIITTPLSLLSALCVYLYDFGPVFYTQKRVGKDGKVFNLYKFRTMHHSLDKNPDASGTNPAWHKPGDQRVTPVGKILRKTHLDEIPQMWNILQGDITLVGPRPERPEFVAHLENTIPYYKLRHIIKPGFTGWAQIKYRYARTDEDSKEKFEYDLYYIKNQNFFLDIGILLRTIQIIFTH